MNKYVLLKIVSILIAAFSQLMLKVSASKKHENGLKEYLNIYVIFSYGISAIGTVLSTYSLKGISITLSSIIEALNYAIIPIISYLFLKERINKTQLLGMIMIVIGAFVFNI